jgi:hypothetical protein
MNELPIEPVATKTCRRAEPKPEGRRRFLALLGLLGAAGLARAVPRAPPPPPALSLREADFYRPHDLAG